MTKKLLLTFALLLTAVTGAFADYSGSCGEYVSYSYVESTQTLTITGTWAMADYEGPSKQPWIDYCSSIKTVVIGAGVTSIGDNAFNGCSNLTSITIPASVTTIGGYAFARTGLTSIEIPASMTSIGEYAFTSCSGLTTVSFAAGSQLATIGNYVFNGCSNLTSITIPANVTRIGNGVFAGCSNLATMTVEAGNTVYDSRNVCNAIIEKSTNTLIAGCKGTTIPTTVTSIGNAAFQCCNGLTSITIPATVTTIGGFAFEGCVGLTSITIPASVTTIGERAFSGCSNLATVTVYAPSCTLEENALLGCNNLANIYVFSDLVNYYKDADNWKNYASKIKEMPNPNGNCGENVRWVLTGESPNYTLTITGTGAMADYEDPSNRPWNSYAGNIKTVVITSGVTSIGNHAFESCTGLASITLAEGLTTIGGYAFYNCGTTIESVTIPESVTSIGENAFNGTNVTNFYINNIPSKIAIGETPFKADGVTIHVFTQMQSTFENATNWSAYTGHFNADIAISHVQSITLDNMIMKTNTSGKLNATIDPADARVKDVVFTSSNDNIIHITNAATGEFEAGSKEGNATITCTAMDGSGKYASCTVTVNKSIVPAQSVTLNKSDMSIEVGNTNKQLTATFSPTNTTYKYVTWRSSDENVATVDNTGNVTAIAPGVATITAISHDGQARANCEVTVYASGSCGTDVTWTLTGTSPNYTLTISGTGTMADYASSSDQPWKDYRSSIKTVVIGAGVTTIGKNAFNGCSNLTSITIPANVTTIKYGAFQGCSGLTSITIPASVTSIGNGVFAGCSNLATMTVKAGNTVYDSRNVCNAIIEKSTNTLIAGCKGTTIPTTVTTIGNAAFQCCNGLTSIEIPASVTSIGERAFEGCTGLATVTVFAPSCSLGVDAFNSCDNLTNIYMLSNYVGAYKTADNWKDYADKISVMFDGISTTTVNIPNDVTVNGVLYNRTFTASKPSTVMLPFSKDVSDISGGTFYTFGGVQKENDKWVATMKAVTGSIEANTPYLFMPTGTSLTFTGGATLNTTGGGNGVTADQGSHWTFKGTYEYKEWISGDANAEEIGKAYGFAGVAKDDINVGDFVKVASGAKIRPMGCYLLWNDTPNASRAAARGAATEELPQSITVRLVSADGEVTSIDVRCKMEEGRGDVYYDLSGRLLQGKPTKKGLYINNGKKIVIK